MQHLNQGTTRKINPQSRPELSTTVQTDQMHQTPYRTIKSYIKPTTTTLKQLQLSRSGKNHLEFGKTIDKHLNQRRTQEIDSHVIPEPINTVYKRSEASSTLKNHQELYQT